jgi:3-deoxy-D-manno-octulosonic-acid transferase
LKRFIYNLVMTLLTPVILARLAGRGLKSPKYFARWRERFGWFQAPKLKGTVWVHAVSVGEFNAAIPLIEALMKRYPARQFVISTVTPTGSDRVVQVFGSRVFHCYLPYDIISAVRRFLQRVKPALAVIMETEIWPNLFIECRARGIPIVVANARLSDKSMKGYRPVISLAATAIKSTAAIAAQTEPDAQRFLKLGARPESVEVVGNIKFDLSVPPDIFEIAQNFRLSWGEKRPVWIAASTHADDEIPVMQAFARVLRSLPDALLILVPRHPERFEAAATLSASMGFRTQARSKVGVCGPDTQCFVADTMGELLLFYAACDVAFVGGSFAKIGGHNALEAAALHKPVIVGPHTFNFTEINQLLVERGALKVVKTGDALGEAVLKLLSSRAEREAMGEAGYAAVLTQRGALNRILDMIDAVFKP